VKKRTWVGRGMRLGLLLVVLLAGAPDPAWAPAGDVTGLDPAELWADGFTDLRGIAADAITGAVYVADRGTGTVTRIDPTGARVVVATGLERPMGLALDQNRQLLIVEERAGRVVRVEATGGRTPLITEVKQPRWLAVGPGGTIYVSARRLTRGTDPEPDDESAEPEVVLAHSPTSGLTRQFAGGFKNLQGVAVHGAALFLATRGLQGDAHGDGVIFQLAIVSDGTAGPPAVLGPADRLKKPQGLTTDMLSALFLTTKELTMAEDRIKRAVGKLDLSGRLTSYAAGISGPQGLAFDAAGHLYVAGGSRVLRFRAPPAPTLNGLPDVTRNVSLTVTGMTVPQARVAAFVNDDPIGATALADTAGHFSVVVALAANADNRLEVFATGHAGDGLTSPSAEARVLHDGQSPAVAILQPAPNTWVRGTVSVMGRGTDAGSGVRALRFTLDGVVFATVTNPAPAAEQPFQATASLDTSSRGDGTHTLGVVAEDRAGNEAAATQTLLVDNTPPDTTITSGPSGTVSETTATLGFTGTDNLAPVNALRFAWRLDGGTYSAFSAATQATVSGLTPGPHTFEVKTLDLAGNEDPTPASRTWTVGQALAVTITDPAGGATVQAGIVVVRGTLSAPGPAPDLAVSVNGVAAFVAGASWVAEVSLSAGSQVIEAAARTASGVQASSRTNLNVVGGPVSPLVLRGVPTDGVAPLEVRWEAINQSGRTLVQFELDEAGSGVFGPPVTTFINVRTLYTSPGLRFPRLRATDDQGQTYTASAVVNVEDAGAAEGRFQALWAAFKARLQAGDIPGARGYIVPTAQPRFERLFQAFGSNLPAVASDLGDIQLAFQFAQLAEIVLTREENGRTMLYFVYFRRDGLGRWLIEEM
jgi:hypothetical protein